MHSANFWSVSEKITSRKRDLTKKSKKIAAFHGSTGIVFRIPGLRKAIFKHALGPKENLSKKTTAVRLVLVNFFLDKYISLIYNFNCNKYCNVFSLIV